MPNHVENRMTVTGDAKEDVFESIKGADAAISFESVIPMPADLKITTGSRSTILIPPFYEPLSRAEVLGKLLSMPEGDMEEAFQNVRNLRNYKYQHSYDWAIGKWGTKWDAYNDPRREGDTVLFQTANSMPGPVFLKISANHPSVTLRVEYADEDIGHNCGIVVYHDGKEASWQAPTNPKRFACALHGELFEKYMQEIGE